MEGTIKFYNYEKRFGFITADDGKEIFFHQTGLKPGVNVKEGDRVSFEVVEGDRGAKAENIDMASGDAPAPAEEAPVEEEAPAEEPVEEAEEEAPAEEETVEETPVEEEAPVEEKPAEEM